MVKSKFAISIHILSLLAGFPDEWLTSEFIAGSLNSNPALVRKELSMLRDAGLVESKEGKNGGNRLARSMKDIRMSEVFNLVKEEHIFGYAPNTPNPDCKVGKGINEALNALFSGIDEAVYKQLHAVTLEEFTRKYF
ncbi:RrF2 family transcriptional regulator [Chitinophaga barathri]|uniref:Rrf2 family transcriptional regulator n=1 Tax=Chitinophaga barathri TaxID=1647451 RepID=A0A3N4ME91_9BACT|nr:Rrf2 family transcriptional regulator [Chitinophaga barathri]RPD41685.1 Rrf2 family transcriptional regulator [Chitinophaga barathri]